jgi:hypothetical protein
MSKNYKNAKASMATNASTPHDSDDVAARRLGVAFPDEDMSAGGRLMNYLVVPEYDPADPRLAAAPTTDDSRSVPSGGAEAGATSTTLSAQECVQQGKPLGEPSSSETSEGEGEEPLQQQSPRLQDRKANDSHNDGRQPSHESDGEASS